MNSPKRQHFIPQSYLRNFATIEGDKAFVEAMNITTREIKYPFSIKDLCVSKNLYTIPYIDEKNKYYLEHYYAKNVDSVYPEVYKMLVDKNIVSITEHERHKILYTTLSLYFRTSRFLDESNEALRQRIDRLKQLAKSKNSKVSLFWGGRVYDGKSGDIDSIYHKAKIDNKLDFILEHIEDWHKFVHHKKHSQIVINRVVGNIPLITSDNSVEIYNPSKKVVNIFDPENCIQLPLDKYHYLWISPNDDECERDKIYRQIRDEKFVLTSNFTTQKFASNWIIGAEKTLQAHLDELVKYNGDTPVSRKLVEDSKMIAEGMVELIKLCEQHGVYSTICINKIIEMNYMSVYANDLGFQDLLNKLKR